jgi:hypothetical protein
MARACFVPAALALVVCVAAGCDEKNAPSTEGAGGQPVAAAPEAAQAAETTPEAGTEDEAESACADRGAPDTSEDS